MVQNSAGTISVNITSREEFVQFFANLVEQMPVLKTSVTQLLEQQFQLEKRLFDGVQQHAHEVEAARLREEHRRIQEAKEAQIRQEQESIQRAREAAARERQEAEKTRLQEEQRRIQEAEEARKQEEQHKARVEELVREKLAAKGIAYKGPKS